MRFVLSDVRSDVVGVKGMGRTSGFLSLSALGLMLVACGGGGTATPDPITPDPVAVSLASNSKPSVDKTSNSITLKFAKAVSKVNLDNVTFGGKKPEQATVESDGSVTFKFAAGDFPEEDDLSLVFGEGAFTFSDQGSNSATPGLEIDTKAPSLVGEGHFLSTEGIGSDVKDTLRLALSEALDVSNLPALGDVEVKRGDAILKVASLQFVETTDKKLFLELVFEDALARDENYTLSVKVTGLQDLDGNRSGDVAATYDVKENVSPALVETGQLVLGKVGEDFRTFIVSFNEELGSLEGVTVTVFKEGSTTPVVVSGTLAYGDGGNDKTKIVVTAEGVIEEGTYAVSLTGIVDVNGNKVDGTLDTASYVHDLLATDFAVSDPIVVSGRTFTVSFNEALGLLDGVTVTVTRGGSAVTLSGTLAYGDGGNDKTKIVVTAEGVIAEGTYLVSLAGIVDVNGVTADSLSQEYVHDLLATDFAVSDPIVVSGRTLTVSFNEALGSLDGVTVTVTRGGSAVTLSGTLAYGDGGNDKTKIVVTAEGVIEEGTYLVSLAGIVDVNGNSSNPLTQAYVYDVTPPVLAGFEFKGNESAVLTFSEDLKSLFDRGDVTLEETGGDGTAPTVASVAFDGDDKNKVVLTLEGVFEEGASYKVLLRANSVVDENGVKAGALTLPSKVYNDTIPPSVVSVVLGKEGEDFKTFIVSFNEALGSLDGVTVTVMKDGEAVAVSGTLAYGDGGDKKKIVVTADDVIEEGTYTLSLTGVVDANGVKAGSLTQAYVHDVTIPTLYEGDDAEMSLEVSKQGKFLRVRFSEDLKNELVKDDIEIWSGDTLDSLEKVTPSIDEIAWRNTVTDEGEASVDRSVIQITLVDGVEEGKFYRVRVKANKVVDDGNNLAGGEGTFLETEVDKVDTLGPVFESVEIGKRGDNFQTFTLSFNEELASLEGVNVLVTRGGSAVALGALVFGGDGSNDKTKIVVTAVGVLREGTYNITVRNLDDTSGNKLNSSELGYVHDVTAPSLTGFEFQGTGRAVVTFSEDLKSLFDKEAVTFEETGGDGTAPVVASVAFEEGSKRKVVVTLSGVFEESASYKVLLSANSVVDERDNSSGALESASLLYDTILPDLVSVEFVKGGSGKSTNVLEFTFSEKLSSVFAEGALKITGDVSVSVNDVAFSGDDTKIVLVTLGEVAQGTYTVTLEKSGVEDENGNKGGGGGTGGRDGTGGGDRSKVWTNSLTFDTLGPVLQDTAAITAEAGKLTLTFDEKIVLLAGSEGKFEIFTTDAGSLGVPTSVRVVGDDSNQLEISLAGLTAGTSYNVRISAGAFEDEFGNDNEGQQTSTTLDETPPTLESAAFVKVGDKTVLDLVFSEDVQLGSLAVLQVRISGEANKTIDADNTVIIDGNRLRVQFTDELGDGNYEVVVGKELVKDSANNQLKEQVTRDLLLDTTPPPTPDITLQASVKLDEDDFVTRDSTPTFELSNLEAGTTVRILVGINEVHRFTATGTTETWTPLTEFAEAKHSIFVGVEDSSGNQVSKTVNVTIDSTLPEKPVMTLVASDGVGDRTNDPTPNVNLSGLNVGDRIEIYVDGVEVGLYRFEATATTLILTLIENLTEGVHTIAARAIDVVGNEGDFSDNLSVTIDTTLPQFTRSVSSTAESFTYDSAGKKIILNFTELVMVADADRTVGNFQIKKSGGGNVSGYEVNVVNGVIELTGLPLTLDGLYFVEIAGGVVKDLAGNAFGGGSALPFKGIDTKPPVEPVVVLKDGLGEGSASTNNTTPTLELSRLEVGARVSIVIDGVSVYSFDATGGTYEWTSGVLAEGVRKIEVKVVDDARNESTGALDVTIDTTPPLLPTLSLETGGGLTKDATPTFTLDNLEVGTKVQLFVKTGTTFTAISDSVTVTESTASVTSTMSLEEISYTIVARATDAVGNRTESAGLVIQVDLGATIPAGGAPSIALTAGGSVTNDSTPSFTVSGLESGLEVKILVNGGKTVTFTATGTSHTFEHTDLVDSEYTIEASFERGGATVKSAGLGIKIDTTPPSLIDGDDNLGGVQSITYDGEGGRFIIYFSEGVTLEDKAKVKVMKIGDSGVKSLVDSGSYEVKVEGSTLVVLGSALGGIAGDAVPYYVEIEAGALSDAVGNRTVSSLETSEVSLDREAPRVLEMRFSFTDSQYTIKFSEAISVVSGKTLTGNIKLRVTGGDTYEDVTASVNEEGDLVVDQKSAAFNNDLSISYDISGGILQDRAGNQYEASRGDAFWYKDTSLEYDATQWNTASKTLTVTFKGKLFASGEEMREVRKYAGLTNEGLTSKVMVVEDGETTNLVSSVRVHDGKLLIQLDDKAYTDGTLKFSIQSDALTNVWGDGVLGEISSINAKDVEVDTTGPTLADGDGDNTNGVQSLTIDADDPNVLRFHFSEVLDSASVDKSDFSGLVISSSDLSFYKNLTTAKVEVEGSVVKVTVNDIPFGDDEGTPHLIVLNLKAGSVADFAGNTLTFSAGDNTKFVSLTLPSPTTSVDEGLVGLGLDFSSDYL